MHSQETDPNSMNFEDWNIFIQYEIPKQNNLKNAWGKLLSTLKSIKCKNMLFFIAIEIFYESSKKKKKKKKINFVSKQNCGILFWEIFFSIFFFKYITS